MGGKLRRIHLAAILMSVLMLSAVSANGATGPKAGSKPNRLLNEASPYLKQHAYNPIDWHPWGEEAFAKARRENKPIFLSIGYATCYWCHVMARESFENKEIAAQINAAMISIKVDRERRPDVDATYMLATEIIARQGGWPNSVLLTPDLKPFFAFGYVPPAQFKDLIKRASTAWQEKPERLRADGERIAAIIKTAMTRQAQSVPITVPVLRRASLRVLSGFDVFNGGLGTAPKFPQENILLFLLHRAERDNDKLSREAALITLDNMIRGGIHDHLAGGFHRYAVDNAWAVPHFEKMLYNQALIVRALLKAYTLTGKRRYAVTARKTLDFVLSKMTTPEGGIVSAIDAETDGHEGLFYLWTEGEIKAALGPDADFAIKTFGVTAKGNLEGRNTLRFTQPPEQLAVAMKLTPQVFRARLQSVIAKLRATRAKRKPLIIDDKVLTSWNALMVRALAEAAHMLKEPRYAEAAKRVQTFILDKLGGANGKLKRSYFEGAAQLSATQTDYALAGLGALSLYDLSGEERWLKSAKVLALQMAKTFQDPKSGALFLTANATGFRRSHHTDDSTLPSGNASALELFGALSQRSQNVEWEHRARGLLAALSGLAVGEPISHAAALVAADLINRGGTGARQVTAHGRVHIDVKRTTDPRTALVRLTLDPGWHINSQQPEKDFLLPTQVSADGITQDAVKFPKPIPRKLAVFDKPLKLFEGQVDVAIRLPKGKARMEARRIVIRLQACSDSICLEPKIVTAMLPAAPQP